MRGEKPFWGFFIFVALVNFALIGFFVWVVVKVMQHFGVI